MTEQWTPEQAREWLDRDRPDVGDFYHAEVRILVDEVYNTETHLRGALAEIERLRAVLQTADDLATVAMNASNTIDGYYYPLPVQLENAAEKYREERKQEASR